MRSNIWWWERERRWEYHWLTQFVTPREPAGPMCCFPYVFKPIVWNRDAHKYTGQVRTLYENHDEVAHMERL